MSAPAGQQGDQQPQKIMSKAERRRERQGHRPMTQVERVEYRDELRALRKEQRIMKSTGKKMKWQRYCAEKRERGEDINDEENSTFFRIPGQIIDQVEKTNTAAGLEPSRKKFRAGGGGAGDDPDSASTHTYTMPMLGNNSSSSKAKTASSTSGAAPTTTNVFQQLGDADSAAPAVAPPTSTIGSAASRLMKKRAVAAKSKAARKPTLQ